jgi:hypothetical protein
VSKHLRFNQYSEQEVLYLMLVTTISIIRRIPTMYVDAYATHAKTYALPEDGQQLRPKHVGALINKKCCAISRC